MNSKDTKIFIFTLPQEIIINEDEKKLVCNIVIMPKFDPLKPLTTPDSIPFTGSDIRLEAFLVKGHAALPELINHNDSYAIADMVLQGVNPDRQGLFEKVGAFFSINDGTGRTSKKAIP